VNYDEEDDDDDESGEGEGEEEESSSQRSDVPAVGDDRDGNNEAQRQQSAISNDGSDSGSNTNSANENDRPAIADDDEATGADDDGPDQQQQRQQQQRAKLSDSWQQTPSAVPPLSAAAAAAADPPKLSYREIQFEKCLADADVVSLVELRKLSWNGVPSKYRALAWKIMLGYVPTNVSRRTQTLRRKRQEYFDAMDQHYNIADDTRTLQEQETLRQVLVDVPRTAPDVPLFRNDRIKRMLTRLLYIWAMRHPASSYVQGINDVATPLVAVFLADYYGGRCREVLDGHVMNHLSDDRLNELEADVYWGITNLLAGIQDHYTSDQPGIQRMVMRLEELVNRIDADLARHLRDAGVQFLQFSFKWMNCLLLREFHLRVVPRLWDTYISEKNGFEDFHVYVCAAFLCQFSAQLRDMTFDELFGFFQEMPTTEWTEMEVEMLLSQAYVLSTLFGGSEAHLTSTNASTMSQH